MSSPAEHHHSQPDILARWMPSSTRAGVILNPCTDLAGSLQHISAVGSVPLEPNDSFASDFAPLPASADSSCLGVDRCSRVLGGESTGTDRPVNGLGSVSTRMSSGQVDSLCEMADKTLNTPLMMKLEQLRKWQQHMQEQLKAHQLVELLRLQEEQQELLGMMNASQHSTGGADWDEDSLHAQENPWSPTINCHLVPQASKCVLEQEQHLSGGQERLPRHQDYEELDEEIDSVWTSRGEDEEQSVDASFHNDTLKPSSGVDISEGSRDEDFNDRPIKPGIGGQKQTFEELLEEQLRLEEERLKSAQRQQCRDGVQTIPKRTFLKRGEGLSRFTNNCKANLPKPEGKKDIKSHLKAKVVSRSNSEPASVQKSGINSVQRVPVQRKTATLNKENQLRGGRLSPQDIRVESKMVRTKVLGSHQRQNTAAPLPIQTAPEDRQTKQHRLGQGKDLKNVKTNSSAQIAIKPKVHNVQPNPVTKQVGTLAEPEKAEHNLAQNKSCSRAESIEGSQDSQGGVPQDQFDLSFQEKLHRWECDQQLESMELGEFELLEQAAEELSFSSNSSFVVKVLQMDRQHKLQAARGLHQRRLSSTPIKSPPREALQRCSSVGSSGGLSSKSSSVKSEVFLVKKTEDAFENKDRVEVKEGAKHECSDQEEVVNAVLFPGNLCFPEQTNPPYDKQSYQDEDICKDSASDVTQDDDGETDSVLSSAEESTLIEDKGGQQIRVVFDDDDTWNDLEDTPVALPSDSSIISPVSMATASSASLPVRTLLRKVALSKVEEPDRATVSANLEPDPPPASQLMTRLFPSLKTRTQSTPPSVPPAPSVAPESKKTVEDTGQQVHSRQLRERLAELEIEIERFKKENAALAKLRQENEKIQENLRKERLAFEQTKLEEMAKFEEYKKEENRKLQKERKLFEKHASAARAIPDKKERDEILVLKQQVSSLQEELRRKESRWAATHSRQRQQINFFSQENSSLRDEIRTLEKLHINALKKRPVGAEKDMKDRPSLSSVTKAVKFASPLDSRGSSSSSSPPQSRDTSQGAAAGMKSSLRRTTGSVTSLPGRKTEEQSSPANESQEQPEQNLSSNCSPKGDLPKQPEPSSPCEEPEPEAVQEVVTHPDGKTEKVLAGGSRLIIFPNGTKKEVSADGLSVKVTFFNGDTKQITADQRVIYYYANAQTTHITYPDGMEMLHFPNNQTEKHFPDGRKEITFPDQTVKSLFPDGREESVLTDGTIIQVNPDGTKEILFNTGQKEIHTADYKRREYPDGTTKTVYSDGRQETRYPNGRLRIKDKDGNVTLDNRA